jgi:hypothetical protein
VAALHAKLGHLGAKAFQLGALVLAEVSVVHPVTVPDLHLLHVTRPG